MSDSVGSTGTDLVELRSAAAINRLLKDLGDLGKLRAAFGTSTANIESCAATAQLVLDTISADPLVVPPTRAMTVQAMITEIMRLLDQPKAVYLCVSKDHHFVTLPVDGSRMAIVQGFQGSYHLVDWFEWCGVGIMSKAEFKAALTDLLASSASPTWIAAALKLFSFDTANTAPGGSTRSKAKVAQDIRDWFTVKPLLRLYAHKPL